MAYLKMGLRFISSLEAFTVSYRPAQWSLLHQAGGACQVRIKHGIPHLHPNKTEIKDFCCVAVPWATALFSVSIVSCPVFTTAFSVLSRSIALASTVTSPPLSVSARPLLCWRKRALLSGSVVSRDHCVCPGHLQCCIAAQVGWLQGSWDQS